MNKSVPDNFLELVCPHSLMPKRCESECLVHPDVHLSLLLPDLGAFICGDPQKLLPDPGSPTTEDVVLAQLNAKLSHSE